MSWTRLDASNKSEICNDENEGICSDEEVMLLMKARRFAVTVTKCSQRKWGDLQKNDASSNGELITYPEKGTYLNWEGTNLTAERLRTSKGEGWGNGKREGKDGG